MSTQEAVCALRSQEQYSCDEEWVSREGAFIRNTRDIVLHIVKERLEIPPMFTVREDYAVHCTLVSPLMFGL